MSKHNVTRLFVGGVIAIIAGTFLAIIALLVLVGGGAVVLGGPEVIAFNGGAAAWTAVFLFIIALAAMLAGSLAGLVSWIGALLNTAQLEDKTWFVLLLILGLISFGFVAMVAYVIAGPDSTRTRPTHPGPVPAG